MKYVLIYTNLQGENKALDFDDRKKADAVLSALVNQTRSGHAVELNGDIISPGTGSLSLVAEVVPIDHAVDDPADVQKQINEHLAERAQVESGGIVPQQQGFGPTVAGTAGGDASPDAGVTKQVQQKSQG